MIYWAPLLHFYQPPLQLHSVLKKVCEESYLPLIEVFRQYPTAKATVNICGVLTEMLWEHCFNHVIEGLAELAQNGQIEFTGSAKYHPILPLIPKSEMHRQIARNHATNRHFFGDLFDPVGFFPPEMGYSKDIVDPLLESRHQWVIVTGEACPVPWPTDVIHHSLRLKCQEGLADPGAVCRRPLADGDIRREAMGRVHLLDRDDLGAVKHSKVDRLTGLAHQLLDKRQGLAVDLHVGEDHAAEFQELEPETVEIPASFLLHEADVAQGGENPVGSAQGEPRAAGNLGQGAAGVLEREALQDAHCLPEGLEARDAGFLFGDARLAALCDLACSHPANLLALDASGSLRRGKGSRMIR